MLKHSLLAVNRFPFKDKESLDSEAKEDSQVGGTQHFCQPRISDALHFRGNPLTFEVKLIFLTEAQRHGVFLSDKKGIFQYSSILLANSQWILDFLA